MNNAILHCKNLYKTYHDGSTQIHVLQNIHFHVAAGARIAIVGPSGSGKSTLLHLLGGLDQPTQGQVLIDEMNWSDLSEKKRCVTRNQNLGFIYQFHHLLPEFSAVENVAMPLVIAGHAIEYAFIEAKLLLEHVGLSARMHHKPAQLSGGERQRVAIARALVHKPRCILADEPTGNLDHSTAGIVFEMMLALNQQFQTSLVMVTHDQNMAERMDKIYVLKDGHLMESD